MQKVFSCFLTPFYGWISRQELTAGTSPTFVKNLGYAAVGFGIATAFAFLFQIVAGRLLGPTEYGTYALIQSIAMFLYLPMNFGITIALVKYNAEKEDYARQRLLLSTSYILTLVFSAVSALFLFLFAAPLGRAIGVAPEILLFSLLFAFLYNFSILSLSGLQSLHATKKLSIVQALSSFLSFGLLFIFFTAHLRSFKGAVLATVLGYLIVFLVSGYLMRRYLGFHVDRFWAKKILVYAFYGFLGGVAIATSSNFDSLAIHRYLTVEDIGLYKAYYVSFINLMTHSFSIFNVVFFPVASRMRSKEVLFHQLNRMLPLIVAAGIPALLAFGFLIFLLYGAHYIFVFDLGMLFAIAGILIFVDGVYVWLMAATGERGIRMTSLAAVTLAVLSVAFNLLLIPSLGLRGAVISAIIAYGISLLLILSQRKYYKQEEDIL